MDIANKEFIIDNKIDNLEKTEYGTIDLRKEMKNLESKLDIEITLAKEVINKRMDNMLEIQDMLDTHKVFMRYLDNISMTAFTLLIITCITVVIFYISAFADYYNFFKIILPFFIGAIIGCIIHVCNTAKNLSIEIFRLSELLKRRKTK